MRKFVALLFINPPTANPPQHTSTVRRALTSGCTRSLCAAGALLSLEMALDWACFRLTREQEEGCDDDAAFACAPACRFRRGFDSFRPAVSASRLRLAEHLPGPPPSSPELSTNAACWESESCGWRVLSGRPLLVLRSRDGQGRLRQQGLSSLHLDARVHASSDRRLATISSLGQLLA